jgi:hypothetical protein
MIAYEISSITLHRIWELAGYLGSIKNRKAEKANEYLL